MKAVDSTTSTDCGLTSLALLSTAMFPLEEPEFETAMCFGLTGVTMSRLAPVAAELDGKHLFGYHCRGLIGHGHLSLGQCQNHAVVSLQISHGISKDSKSISGRRTFPSQ